MNVFDAIKTRRSIGRVHQHAPPRAEIEKLLEAAIEAPNHHETQPWRFFVLAGAAREEFGEVLADALKARSSGEDAAKLEGLMVAERAKPVRAPVLIVVGVKHDPSEYVLPVEDLEASAAAAQNILLAAHGLGLAAQWRTGDGAFDPNVKAWFGLNPEDEIAAIIYVGYRDETRDQPRTRTRTFHDKTEWRGWDSE